MKTEFFVFLLLISVGMIAKKTEGELTEVKVGVILETELGIGKMSLRCIEMSLSDFYDSHPHYKTRLILNVRNSNSSVVGAATAGFLQGVVGIKTYVPESKFLEDFTLRWKKNSSFEDLNVYGLWAYDATTSLAIAVENCFRNSLRLSENLLQVLLTTRFKGLAGYFRVPHGDLLPSGFEIINGIGDEERVIGFWSTKNRIVKEPNSKEKADLGAIIWPGGSKIVPKGWVFPINGTKLRIGIPVKAGFSEFVKIVKDPITNEIKPTGFCIDVFEEVVASLLYALPFEYIPYSKPDEDIAAGTYDELVHQVFLGQFDAVVGDVTVRANRSLYVDFTLSFTESGVNMIVPVEDKNAKNEWAFLKPLTWDLWITSFCFFIFIGMVICILELNINDDFGKTVPQQIGTSLWFSFSVMTFAHNEKLVNNLTRFVVIIWCFVVLVLIQSYTASLAATLTVKKLEPAFTSMEELFEKDVIVGHPTGSFVKQLLISRNVTKLVEYKSRDDLHIKFVNKEISAAFDEIPYMKIFLTKHCSRYTMVGPTLNTNGFAFVFPKGSPLVADISREVLRVTEGEKMENIERQWFGKRTVCPDASSSLSSTSLGINSFWGLFLIVGVAAVSALIVFAYQERSRLMQVYTLVRILTS